MRRTAPLLLAALAAIIGSGTARAADDGSASAQGRVTAVVVAPVSALALDDLDFGQVAADAPGGEVTVAPMTGETGVRPACNPLATCPQSHAARFAVTGEAGRGYAITAPASLRILSPGIGEALLVDNIRVKTRSRPDAGPAGLLDGSGSDLFEVGGTLHLGSAQAGGHYRSDVPVIVTYF